MRKKSKLPNTTESTWNKTPEFKALEETWYKKLKDTGFNDIEYNEDTLNETMSSTRFGKMSREFGGWQAKFTYYNMAEQFLLEYKFDNQFEQIVWEYHSQGISVRDIADILKKVRNSKASKSRVWQIVNKLSLIMKSMYLYKGDNTDVH